MTMDLSRKQKKLNKRFAAHFQRSIHIWFTKRCYTAYYRLQCFKFLGGTLLYTTIIVRYLGVLLSHRSKDI